MGPRPWVALLAGMVMCLPGPAGAAYVIDRLLVGIHEDRSPESPIIQVVPTGSPIEVVERDADFARVRTSEGVTGWVDASYVTDDKPAHLALEELRTADAARVTELKTARATIERLQAELANATKASHETPSPAAPAAGGPAAQGGSVQAELDRALEQNRLLQEEVSLREMAAKRDAAAEIEALKAEVARLRGTKTPAGTAPIASPDLRELQRLAEENRRLKAELDSAAASARRAGQRTAGHLGLPWSWSIRSATGWQLAAIGFGVLLAFFLGAFWIDASARRRLGGFRL